MTDTDMTVAVVLAVIGYASIFAFFTALIIVACRRPKGQGAPRYQPDPAFRDRPSVADLELALEHDALIEDVEVAWLESIPTLPYNPWHVGS